MGRYLGQDENFQFWKIHPLYTHKQCIPRILWCHAALIDPRNELFCKIHEQLHLKVMSVITNVYFNNKKTQKDEAQEVELLPILWPLIKSVPKKM